MALIPLNFEYLTGLRRPFLVSARLTGSWNAQGFASEQWSFTTMQPFTAEDGCPAFRATVQLDDSQIGQTFRWGVSVGTPDRPDVWGIASEINDADVDRTQPHLHVARRQPDRALLLHALPTARGEQAHRQRADGDPLRRLGAERAQRRAGPRFSRRRAVRGAARRIHRRHSSRRLHIGNDGAGDLAGIPMHRGDDGIWSTDVADAARSCRLRRASTTPVHVPDHQGRRQRRLPHRLLLPLPDRQRRNESGGGERELERTLSRSGRLEELLGGGRSGAGDDPVRGARRRGETGLAGNPWLPEDDFWRDEFDPNRPLPSRIEDLVIYELHIDSLGLDRVDRVPGRGTLQDALEPDPLPARSRRQLRRADADVGVPGSRPTGVTAPHTTSRSNTPAAAATSSSTSSANATATASP